MGLYGGLRAHDIYTRKGLKRGQQILDHIGSTELAANLFRATQTEDKLRREQTQVKDAANRTHEEVGQVVRETIRQLGGTMPEDLRTPPKSIQQVRAAQRKELPPAGQTELFDLLPDDEGAIGTLVWAICGSSSGRYHEEEAEFRGGNDVLSNVDPSWYFRKPGDGPLYDMTVYQLHMITSVLGRVQAVTALSGTRIIEREFRGKPVPTDAHDNTLILLDFGNNLFALAYGTAAGSPSGWTPTYYGTSGVISDWNLNGQRIAYPGHEQVDPTLGWDGEQVLLPHVVGAHRIIGEQHVFEDIMQLVDWIREDKPTPVLAEHARHVIEIIKAAYTAAETGQTQTLKTTF